MRRAFVALVLAFAGCAAPTAQLLESEEYYAGRGVAARILADYKPLPKAQHGELIEYVQLLGNLLAYASDRPELYRGYTFGIVHSEEANAFAAPSGFIFVTTGLLRLCETEDELAGVLAHEIAHVNLQHPELAFAKADQAAQDAAGVHRTATGVLAGAGGGFSFGGFSVGGRSSGIAEEAGRLQILLQLFGPSIENFVTTMVTSGYERGQELEADLRGADILARDGVGYSPWGMVNLLDRMARAGQQRYGWLSGSTHPSPQDRAAALREYLKDRPAPATHPKRAARFAHFKSKIPR